MNETYILFILMIAFFSGTIFYLSNVEKKKLNAQNDKNYSNDFFEILDIKNEFIHKYNSNICILKITPVSKDLLSANEEKELIRNITNEFSIISEKFKFIAVSRPIDIAPLLEMFQERLTYANEIQRQLLRNEITQMTEFALSNEVVERQFFILLSEEGSDSHKKLRERVEKFLSNSTYLKLELLSGKDLIKFQNLINNPSTVNLENVDLSVEIPTLY